MGSSSGSRFGGGSGGPPRPYGSRPPGGPGGPSGGPGGRPRPRFYARRKVCGFCVDHVTHIDYKSADTLKRYMSDRARVEPRRKTGTCAMHQRILREALMRARHLALLPFTLDHILDSRVLPARR